MSGGCLVLVNPEHRGHQSPGHPERPERVEAILAAIERSELGLQPEASPEADPELIARAHDPRYVAMLDRAAAAGGGYLDPDTYLTPRSMAAARTAAGAVALGVNRVLDGTGQHAFAVVRPPGHHAEYARAMGFCLLNNIAVGVHAARARGVHRIAVIDFDVHHGNGTQHSFADDEELLYVSSHQYPFYPGTGGPSEQSEHLINLPFRAGAGEVEVLSAYEHDVQPAVRRFRPELVLVSAGFDAHINDSQAALKLSTHTYARLAELIVEWAHWNGSGRTIWALEGGYDLTALGDSVTACLNVLSAS
jgi:acetoin utilization deacetylase AcuC-like enzyme